MTNYLLRSSSEEDMGISISDLERNAHEREIVCQVAIYGENKKIWKERRHALLKWLHPLNKEKTSKMEQIKDLYTFNEDFLRFIFYIPYISMEEKIDQYIQGLLSPA